VFSGMKQSPSRTVRYICVHPRLDVSNPLSSSAATRALLGAALPNPSSPRLPRIPNPMKSHTGYSQENIFSDPERVLNVYTN
jgi:hypothetical protein